MVFDIVCSQNPAGCFRRAGRAIKIPESQIRGGHSVFAVKNYGRDAALSTVDLRLRQKSGWQTFAAGLYTPSPWQASDSLSRKVYPDENRFTARPRRHQRKTLDVG
jgi:hypothetical protein